MSRRPSRGKKLLSASLGVGTLTIISCATFPGCNLGAPPPCSESPSRYDCRDQSVPEDLEQPTPPRDLNGVD